VRHHRPPLLNYKAHDVTIVFGTLVGRVPTLQRVYSWRGYNSNVSASSIFSTDRIPSLSRIPKELGREERLCERCGTRTEHILYRVPKKVVLVYVKEHPENLHATCVVCARSTILSGEERERILSSLRDA
jgi:hypothetical protein